MATCQGAVTNSVELPTQEEITVPQELTVPALVLKTGSFHLGKYCENTWKEFVLCRNECQDPTKCLKEGADLTACGVDFFRKVKKLCRKEFDDYLYCVDVRAGCRNWLSRCRKPQRVFDKCMLDNLNLERPRIGYYSVPRIHQTDRPRPPPMPFRDYKAEAQFMQELPDDYPVEKDYKRFYTGPTGAFF